MTASRFFTCFSLLIGLIFTSGIIRAEAKTDINNGKALHDSHCTGCHVRMQGGDGSTLYTRENKRMQSHADLAQQVKRCNANTGAGWDEGNVDDVVEYLNTTFYKFKVN